MKETNFMVWDKILKVRERALVIYFNNKEVYFIHKGNSQLRSFNSVELLPFSGVLDRNNKEIYKGDIVKQHLSEVNAEWRDIIDAVCFDEGCFIIGAETEEFLSPGLTEVIGNIYENPELLENLNA